MNSAKNTVQPALCANGMLKYAILLSTFLLFFSTFSKAQNPVSIENALPGNPSTEWDISGAGDLSIQGFATDLSIDTGTTVDFKIDVKLPATNYSIKIYRLGYYGGNGARLVADLGNGFAGQAQPAPLYETATGKTDCSNWAVSASWTATGAVSGIYIAKITRADNNGSSHIVFVVRNDNGNSKILFKTSDATWQAYNGYGGNSLYVNNSGTSVPGFNHATKVSYNRPFYTRAGGGGSGSSEDWIFNAEYPMVRWMERNGYDVSYTTDMDMDRDATVITPSVHKVLLSVGHDEYWSLAERTKFETARNNGVHLAFFSGNEVYWKTRWEDNHRTLVCYKEGTMGENTCGGDCDPTNTWTGLWRDGCTSSAPDGCRPENALTGQISWGDATGSILVPDTYKNLRFWRNTSIATLGSGQTATLPNGTLGYEFDFEQYPLNNPAGRIQMSSTTLTGKTHKLSLYRHASGAWVFGAGTVQWSWGLDENHDRGNEAPSVAMQQATVNLFADMGVQPVTIQPGLVIASASTDNIAPSSVITTPANGSTVIGGANLTISGTASDANAIGGVEVSVDGGSTWTMATGTTSWSINVAVPNTAGSWVIKSRAFDDNGNMETAGASGPNVISVIVTGRPSPNTGTGGPILVVYKSTNEFSRYTAEVLRAQGLNEFDVKEIGEVNAGLLAAYDVVVLGEMSLSGTDVSNFTNWVNSGGTFIAFKPDVQLSSLLGITATGNSLSNQYLLVNTANGPGAGIVNQTIQFHGAADYYNLNGASAIATLYSNATTPTIFPAVTKKLVGTNGGAAFAFTYDLAKSIVYTRQGNPAWINQNRDGQSGPDRSNDLFFGNASGDPQPDWVNLDKVAIPQADEQQQLLTNIIIQSNLHRKPLPRFWFLPSGKKAAVVMTGDDHAAGGTIGRFDQYLTLSGSHNNATDIADWKAIRGSSYIFPNTPITNAQAAAYEAQGFEIGVHLNTGCANYTQSALNSFFATQLGDMATTFPGISATSTHRTHCIAWSGWSVMAAEEFNHGIYLDANYYYWPDTWVQNRPGMFTGSGMPMRFATLNGAMIDCYQVATQLTDESGINYTLHINSLLDKATGPEGYYGVFCANMHTDVNGGTSTAGSDAIIAAAQAKNIPVISAKQMLTWLDGRNSSAFTNLVWNNNILTFGIDANAQARNLKAMLPKRGDSSLVLQSITRNGNAVTFTSETIKGIEYAFFDAASGNYTAIYQTVICTTPTAVLASTSAAVCNGNGPVSIQLSAATGAAPYTIVVNGQTYTNVTVGTPFITYTPNELSTWNNNVTGGEPTVVDNSAVELGVKFRSATAGYITGIRFYKRTANTGTHTGSLWSVTGTLLATVTFTAESASGWQQAKFSSPVHIDANTTYVASYFAPNGQYAFTANAFQSSGITNGPLTLLQSGTEGPNGVYKYNSSSVFPNDSYNHANYWVDVLFVPEITTPQVTDFVLSSITTDDDCVNNGPLVSNTTVTVNPLPTGTIATSLGNVCRGSNIQLTFNATAGTGPFQLMVNGNTYNNVQSGVSFATGITAIAGEKSIWGSSGSPTTPSVNDNSAIELGVKFRSSVHGTITGIRIYKGSAFALSGMVGKLYSASGTLLASVNFTNTNNNNVGWVEARFSSPVAVTANTTYVASYFSPAPGWFAMTPGYFSSSAYINQPLTALKNGTDGPNGIYKYGGGFPDQNPNGANYWVDVLFETISMNLALTSITDNNGCGRTMATDIPVFIVNCGPLPISLLDLHAVGAGTKAQLYWSTSFEQNNRGFEIQRSVDGVNWLSIGFVPGRVNSNTLQKYTYDDIGLSPSRYYYRLKQLDIDDRFTYSNIAIVNMENKNEYVLGQNYPNPFDKLTTITYYLPRAEKVNIMLFDIKGRAIKVILEEFQQKGSYNINVQKNELAGGVYYYRMTAGKFTSIKKMIIQ
ncbi:MAG: DUF4082 domain-containing protein [Chitinophagaceae bacterium]|nr:DUF4082 domain-containing protein [Chitinophagaceae bacterium]